MSAHSVGCVTLWPRSLLLLAALPWGLLSEALASTDNTLQNRSSAAVRVAVDKFFRAERLIFGIAPLWLI